MKRKRNVPSIRIPGDDDNNNNNNKNQQPGGGGGGGGGPSAAAAAKDSGNKKAASSQQPTKKMKSFEEVVSPLPNPISRLKLEAIFHPKFENEKSDHQIREEMLNRVDDQKGYLEVSLKHSGCLILWSGGQRFFSKNSTDNQFTHVAEIILMQHFERAWRNSSETTTKTTTTTGTGNDTDEEFLSHPSLLPTKYYECSKYAEENRLTLAFELVTAVLGDHGDIPKRDFMVLTAVADKSNERFYTTTEIIKFAQQFRLPHNDTWMFSSLSTAEELFRLYDNNMETGLASDTVMALSKIADAHVASMYPHAAFQGEILEGYIVRYVPYPSSQQQQPNEQQQQQQQSLSPAHHVVETLAELSKEAQNILEEVPPDLPASFEVDTILKEKVPCLSVNIRTLFESVDGPKQGLAASNKFADVLSAELSKIGIRRHVERVNRKHADLPALTQALTKSIDTETRRIALLLQNLATFSKAITYGYIQEEQPSSSDDTGKKEIRHVCIIHVLHDEAFMKFQKRMKPGDMALFRGFSIELSGKDPTIQEGEVKFDAAAVPDLPVDSTQKEEQMPLEGNDSLMLKKKLLPYMVRTFICRNGLSLAQNKGPQAFMSNAVKLLDRWDISSAGKEKWIPFFEAWAEYTVSCFQNGGGGGKNPNLPKLSSFSYLSHLEHFTNLYERGELNSKISTKSSSFQGLVCILAPTKSVAEKVATIFGNALDGAPTRDIHEVAERSIMRGCICYGTLADGSKRVKKHLFEISDISTIVLFGCSDDEIDIQLVDEAGSGKKRMKGLCKFWRKTECALKLELPLSLLSSDLESIDDAEAFQKTVEQIQTTSNTAETQNSGSPGLLVFFPQIPGCGKSTIVSTFEKDFEEFCTAKSKGTASDEVDDLNRKILVRIGDKMKGPYWPQLKKDLRKDPSCILVADKNTPPPSWRTVTDLCADSNVVPLAIFPDKQALQTTEVKGSRKPDNSFSDSPPHVYPFSLAYLAVCIARVLERNPKTHAGKLDSGTPIACMIVIMFFSLYRQVSAESFKDTINMKLGGKLSQGLLSPIELPFFDDSEPISVPPDVQEVLVEALQLQFGYDSSRTKVKPSDPVVQTMEKRIRDVVGKHTNSLLSESANLEKTRKAFYEQMHDRLSDVNCRMDIDSEHQGHSAVESSIRLVSIDVPKQKVHGVLKDHASGMSAEFLNTLFNGQKDVFTKSGNYRGDEFIDKTHVTMAFGDRSESQTHMRDIFGPVLGCEVNLLVTGLIWSESHAAYAVKLPEKTIDEKQLPRCENAFVHITIWVAKGFKSVGSNDLPSLVKEGKAKQIDLETPAVLGGKISFWTIDQVTDAR